MNHIKDRSIEFGQTPVAMLSSFGGPDAAEISVKLEAANPTGSYNDRMTLAMIEGATTSTHLMATCRSE